MKGGAKEKTPPLARLARASALPAYETRREKHADPRHAAHAAHAVHTVHAAHAAHAVHAPARASAAGPAAAHLDPVIHERTRLAILTALYTLPDNACSFLDLRGTLALTDGNLMAHLRTLEAAGLIEREKEGAGRGSSTTVQLSTAGKRGFKSYLDSLEALVRTARGVQHTREHA